MNIAIDVENVGKLTISGFKANGADQVLFAKNVKDSNVSKVVSRTKHTPFVFDGCGTINVSHCTDLQPTENVSKLAYRGINGFKLSACCVMVMGYLYGR